jgi:hypothetical protein
MGLRVGIPPTHFQWREALLTPSTRAITAPLYYSGEAGFRGTAYNFIVKGFHAAVEVMNVVLIPPMWLAVLAFGIVTLPFQALRLVLSPTTFSVVMYWMFTVPVATPIIWLLGLPVHILNLLGAVIVYVWGPKPPALWMNQQ